MQLNGLVKVLNRFVILAQALQRRASIEIDVS
jgi:hypothetical protein